MAEAEFARQVMIGIVGEQNVLPQEPTGGAEDFAFMLQAKPGAYVFIANGDGDHRDMGHGGGPCTLHNPSYDFNDALIPLGGTYWVELARQWLANRPPDACRLDKKLHPVRWVFLPIKKNDRSYLPLHWLFTTTSETAMSDLNAAFEAAVANSKLLTERPTTHAAEDLTPCTSRPRPVTTMRRSPASPTSSARQMGRLGKAQGHRGDAARQQYIDLIESLRG